MQILGFLCCASQTSSRFPPRLFDPSAEHRLTANHITTRSLGSTKVLFKMPPRKQNKHINKRKEQQSNNTPNQQHPSEDTNPNPPYFAPPAPPPIDASSSPFGFSSSHDSKDIFGILQNEKVAVPARSVRFTEPAIPIPDRGHGSQKQTLDPFEVRIRFTQHLQHLNASVTSANKAAQYALKYRDMDEDLHSCILEQLEKVRFALWKYQNWRNAANFLLLGRTR